MTTIFSSDPFNIVFGVLAAIFLLSALINVIRTRIRRNRKETSRLIESNGNNGDENAPVKLENPFTPVEEATAGSEDNDYVWR